MILYLNNDTLMCKIFATTLQGKAQDWFYTLPPQSTRSFNKLSLVFTKEYSSYRSIEKKFNYLFNIKKNPKESICNYMKRFKAKKAKIIRCNNSIASAIFQKGLPTDHLLFRELIMKEDLTLADPFTLADKHVLWDKARRCTFKANLSNLEYEVPHYSEGDSRSNQTSSCTQPFTLAVHRST
ncbi:uncharacterized protein [Pyrus communis]|uniref:uncharacterized protein n=1 Tax=Pyrus communis TaxID=23211 RepID=UPI0035BEE6DC